MMPNRYGENDDTAAESQPEPTYTQAYAIANCGLCDDDGVRGMHRCDHIDHARAARRGMELIREAMGWQQ